MQTNGRTWERGEEYGEEKFYAPSVEASNYTGSQQKQQRRPKKLREERA